MIQHVIRAGQKDRPGKFILPPPAKGQKMLESAAVNAGSGCSMIDTLASHGDLLSPLINTLLLLLGTGLLSLAIAGCLLWLVAARELPGRDWALRLQLLPLATPPFVVAWALAGVQIPTGGLPDTHDLVLIKSILIYALSLYPLVYLPLLLASRQHNPAIIETVRTDGLDTSDYLRHIILPLARYPAITGLMLALVYVLADYPGQQLMQLDTLSSRAIQLWQQQAGLMVVLPYWLLLLAISIGLVGFLGVLRGRLRAKGQLHEASIRLTSGPLRQFLTWALTLIPLSVTLVLPMGTALQQLTWSGIDLAPLTDSLLLAMWVTGFATLTLMLALRPPPHHQGSFTLMSHVPALLIALLLAYGLRSLPETLAPEQMGVLLAAWLISLKLVSGQSAFQASSLVRICRDCDAVHRACGRGYWRTLLQNYRPYLWIRLGPGLLLLFILALRELPISYLLLPDSWRTLALLFYPAALHNEAVAIPTLLMIGLGLLSLPLIVQQNRLFFRHPYALKHHGRSS
jgi:iron(III) transport system permease protein